eukprot:GFUD01093507.1.p1 GENE.GFUD01093507.1~~GFUD01093507.1.p1  ORF type:complete len:238 (-),score=36.55 GFUD01093507.1:91-804(-)
MLITLGLGSAVGFMSAVTTTICDSFPDTNKKLIIKICCIVGFAIGLFYVTPGGQIMLEMVDYYGGTMLILVLASIEIVAINWIYGTSMITRDLNFMLGSNLSVYWRFCWGILCPILLPLLFFYALFTQAGVPNIPPTAQVCGWILAILGMLIVPVHLLLSVIGEEEGEFRERFVETVKSGMFISRLKDTFTPNNSWGPSSIQEKTDWQIYQEENGLYQWLPKCIRRKVEKAPGDEEI